MTVASQAMRIISAAVDAGLATALAADPLAALAAHGYHVLPVPELGETRGTGGWCDGMSFHRHGALLYVPTDSKRQNFTVLHEFAHGLVQADDDALDWLGEQDDPDEKLEQLCNEIASRILLPDGVLDAVIKGEPLEAIHLTRLADTTAASQEVCAIALARRLPCAGMIVITDRDRHEVVRAAVHGDLRFRPVQVNPSRARTLCGGSPPASSFAPARSGVHPGASNGRPSTSTRTRLPSAPMQCSPSVISGRSMSST